MNKNKRVILLCIIAGICILSFFAYPALCQTRESAPPGQEEETIQLEEVVVTATRFPTEMKKVAGRIDVITSEDIEEMPYERVDELLMNLSGVQTNRSDGIFELSPQVTMRGLGGGEPGRTLVLIDGAPASVGDTGNMRWNRVNLADIERIEVFKGPGSSIYGSNAMGGVINIITKRPEKQFSGEVSAGYGSLGTKQGSARFGGRQKGESGFYGQVAATMLDSDGYTSLTEDSSNYENRIDRFVEEFTLNTKVGYSLNDRNSLELSHSYFDDRRGEGYKYNIDDGSHRDFDTNSFKLLHKGDYKDWQWRINAFFQREAYYYHRDFEDKEDLYTVDSDRDDYGTTLSLAKELGPWSTIIMGGDVRISSVDAIDDYDFSDDYAKNEGQLNQYAVYLQDEIRMLDDQLVLVAGLRYDNAKFEDGAYYSNISPYDELSGEVEDSEWDALSPKISARYFFTKDLSLFGSYSRGFRAPILDALCRYGIYHGRFYDANPELENEMLDSFEIGGDATLAKDLKFSLSAYYSRGQDFIYSIDTGNTRFIWGRNRSVYRYENVTEVEIKGVETDVTYQLTPQIGIFAHYTYNHSSIEEFEERPELEDKKLEYVPEHSVSAGVTLHHSILNARLVVNHIGKQYTDDENTEEIGSYETVDLKLWRNLDFLLPGTSVSLTIQNLFDETHLRSEDEESPGLFAIGEISYTW